MAGGGSLQKVHAPHQGGLSRAGETDDAEDLAPADVQIDVLQRVDGLRPLAERLGQILDLNDGFAHGSHRPFLLSGIKKRP